MNAPVKAENQIAEHDPKSIKAYVSDAKIRQKFEEVLGKKTQGFLASVMQVANQPQLKGAVPATVINAAMMAATLDLPINNNLGFAYIVPYKRKFKDAQGKWSESLEAQFQMGYKGFIQLAQRSGQFARIAATPVFEGQLISANPLLGYEFDWTIPNQGEAIGYVAFFKLLNGFTAELYMSTADIKKHAGKYSQSFKYGSGVWKDNFESMALKTVTKLLLSKQAPLSIEMQTAQLADQAIVRDVETNDFDYIDHNESVGSIEAPETTLDQQEFQQLITSIQSGDLDKAFVLSGEAGYVLSETQKAELAGV
ncbi:recombinase, phage RecT family protein [Acinetobacter sp. 869535]|uniref:recombinase RecT n=1 Tax=Acinetobacter sp. 869535 TaxID=1310621 RepID=UPI00044D84EB|nr:recombinase RecT [Acinetobacter sp. 869535]EXC34413.1 recombinase, phage RecT family protein [Acinetobacter sp. 869535]